MGAGRTGYATHSFSPGTDAKASEVNENLAAVADGLYARIRGADCTDGNTNGVSITTQCNLTLPDDRAEVDDEVQIGDGSREWRTTVFADREVSFSDSDLVKGTAGTANYNTIKDSLEIKVVAMAKTEKQIVKQNIQLAPVSDGKSGSALTGEDLRVSETDATTLKKIADSFAVEHDKDNGLHNPEIIDAPNIKEECFEDETWLNEILNAYFLSFSGGASAIPDCWEEQGTPSGYSLAQDLANDAWNTLSITVDALQEGIRQDIEAFRKGENCALSVELKAVGSDQSLTILIDDGVGSSSLNQSIGTTDYVRMSVLRTLDASATQCRTIIRSEESSGTFKIRRPSLVWGDLRKDVAEDVESRIARQLEHMESYCPDASLTNFDRMVLTEAIVVRKLDAYAITAPTGDYVRFTFSDGSTEIYVEVANGQNYGTPWAGRQKYSSGATLTWSRVAGGGLSNTPNANVRVDFERIPKK